MSTWLAVVVGLALGLLVIGALVVASAWPLGRRDRRPLTRPSDQDHNAGQPGGDPSD